MFFAENGLAGNYGEEDLKGAFCRCYDRSGRVEVGVTEKNRRKACGKRLHEVLRLQERGEQIFARPRPRRDDQCAEHNEMRVRLFRRDGVVVGDVVLVERYRRDCNDGGEKCEQLSVFA